MWDTVHEERHVLARELPCQRCGHAPHTFLTCDAGCGCVPAPAPQAG